MANYYRYLHNQTILNELACLLECVDCIQTADVGGWITDYYISCTRRLAQYAAILALPERPMELPSLPSQLSQ